MDPLDPIEVRTLGSLLEKELTTPDNYPLSLNALMHACNQTSNREPVMQLDEAAVLAATDRLRRKSLARALQKSDSRVMKYYHLMTESLNLDRRELAVMDVLMLRGPQTLGEIRTRTGRMAEFESAADVEATLDALANRAEGALVQRLPRRPGQKEARFAHLMSGDVNVESVADESVPLVREAGDDRVAALEVAVDEIRKELADVRRQLDDFRKQFE